MKFWPHDSFEVETSMSFEEILVALDSEVEPWKLFRLFAGTKTFQGHIFLEGFEISPIYRPAGGVRPLIRGTFERGHSGIKLAIRMGLTAPATVWLIACLVILAITTLALSFALLTGEAEPSPMLLFFPLGLFLWLWVILSISFWPAAYRAKRKLIEMIQR